MEIEHTDSQVSIESIARQLLVAIGEDPTRPGLIDTPRRFAKWWDEFINYDPGNTNTVFESVTTDQMVVVSGIRVWSICEHHLLPFWCNISIGYIATDKVLGLSKFVRICEKYAHRLQIQERLIHEISNEVSRITETDDVAVYSSGKHLCMMMRGVKSDGLMKTSILKGRFREYSKVRDEFFSIIME